MSGEPDEVVAVAEMFGEVARALASHGNLQTILDTIVTLAVEDLASCEFAGISLREGSTVTSPASSNDVPRVVDEIQSELQQGPCIDSIHEHDVFQTGDLASERRWPEFSARAHAETGITSILSVRLFMDERTMGALNLYSTRRDAFDHTDVALASVFAVHAAVAMDSARREQDLEAKARSRDVIGQAKGILMARSGVPEDQAFDLLRLASQRMNVKLRDIAERIAHGESLYDADVTGDDGRPGN